MPVLKAVSELGPIELYEVLEKYVSSNNLYDADSQSNYDLGKWLESLKPIRNVAPRSVEFYASKILAGPVEVVTGEDEKVHPLKDAIDQVMTWSNFAQKAPVFKRSLSKLGDLFWKVVIVEDKVFLEQIEAKYVTEFEVDSRGYLEKIRIEIQMTREDGSTYYYVEYWQKGEKVESPTDLESDTDETPSTEDETRGYFAQYEAPVSGMPLDEMVEMITNYGELTSLGIDFIPIVQIKFRDTGAARGMGCFTHALDKIDEANRQATRLAFMVFKNAQGVWQRKTMGTDKDGRPIPKMPMLDSAGKPTNDIEMSDNAFVDMPAGSELISTIPPINYEAIRNIANDMVKELYEDMPELRYYAQTEGANLSGKALTYILAGAVDRAKEAGANFAAGLTRVLKMALTMGQFAKVLQVAGSYDNGDFDFTITVPDPFPPDDTERATLFAQLAGQMDKFLAMKLAGYAPEIIEEARTADEDAQRAKAELAINMVNKIGAQNDAARKEAADKKNSNASKPE
jgi:hypothetical protein